MSEKRISNQVIPSVLKKKKETQNSNNSNNNRFGWSVFDFAVLELLCRHLQNTVKKKKEKKRWAAGRFVPVPSLNRRIFALQNNYTWEWRWINYARKPYGVLSSYWIKSTMSWKILSSALYNRDSCLSIFHYALIISLIIEINGGFSHANNSTQGCVCARPRPKCWNAIDSFHHNKGSWTILRFTLVITCSILH